MASASALPGGVRAMDRFNKVADARAAERGMSTTVVSSATARDALALDADPAAGLTCATCAEITPATHIASVSGDEQALCAACAAAFAAQWHGAPDVVFVLTLSEVRALDARKPRVKRTVCEEELWDGFCDAMEAAPAAARRALADAVSRDPPNAADGAVDSAVDSALPSVCVAVAGCGCCRATFDVRAASLADLARALEKNYDDDVVDSTVRRLRDERLKSAERRVALFFTNDAGGVMSVLVMPESAVLTCTSDAFGTLRAVKKARETCDRHLLRAIKAALAFDARTETRPLQTAWSAAAAAAAAAAEKSFHALALSIPCKVSSATRAEFEFDCSSDGDGDGAARLCPVAAFRELVPLDVDDDPDQDKARACVRVFAHDEAGALLAWAWMGCEALTDAFEQQL